MQTHSIRARIPIEVDAVWVDPVRGGLEEEGNPGYWEFQAAYITLQNGKRVDISASLDMDAEEDIDHELQKQ